MISLLILIIINRHAMFSAIKKLQPNAQKLSKACFTKIDIKKMHLFVGGIGPANPTFPLCDRVSK